jgi:elongation factor P
MGIKAIDVRRGMAVSWRDGIWVIIKNEKVAKGNWRSYQVVALKNIRTGQLLEERFRTDEQFDQAMLDRKPMEYLYSEGRNLIVMDPESYEQVPIPAELVGDQTVYLTPNLRLEVAFVEGKPVTVELPNTVELKVVDTPPSVKGATVTSQLKEAACEGGARVRVPSFVENGILIKVDTRTGEYLSRA